MPKLTRYGAIRGSLSDPGARSARKGLRCDKPIMRSGALVTIGFFNLYLAMHYIRLALSQTYQPSLLAEAILIVLSLTFLFLKDRNTEAPQVAKFWCVKLDRVDGPRSPASMCHNVVVGERHN